MTNQVLGINVKCKGSDPCVFEGQDLFLEIRMTNNQRADVKFPLAYIQKTGPVIRLIDKRTQAESYLKKNLADLDLRRKFTAIPPGQSVLLEWVITAEELRGFGGHVVDLCAEVTVKTVVEVNGQEVDYYGTDSVRIVGKENPR